MRRKPARNAEHVLTTLPRLTGSIKRLAGHGSDHQSYICQPVEVRDKGLTLDAPCVWGLRRGDERRRIHDSVREEAPEPPSQRPRSGHDPPNHPPLKSVEVPCCTSYTRS